MIKQEVRLTGVIQIQRTWYGKVLIQVEVEESIRSFPGQKGHDTRYRFRDAKRNDPLSLHYRPSSFSEKVKTSSPSNLKINCTLTGNIRPRRTWYGKVVLQVELRFCHKTSPFSDESDHYYRWRDAKPNDPLQNYYGSLE